MAIKTKKSAASQVKDIAERTKGMVEFVFKVDMNLDAPFLCSGAIINFQKCDKQVPVIITNLKEYSKFFTVDQLEGLKGAIERSDKNSFKDIRDICPNAIVSPVFDDVTMSMLMNPQSGAQLMAMFMYEAFITSPNSRLCGSKLDIRNFASRVHVYFNRYPAGVGAGTTIKMVTVRQIPHLVNLMKSSDVAQLVCLNEATQDITVSMTSETGSVNKIVVEPALIGFVDDEMNDRSKIATSFFDMIVIFERLRNESEDAKKKFDEAISKEKEKNKKLKDKLK